MIDFIKAEVAGVNISHMERHPLLKWESKIDCETPDELGKFAQARFQGLLFKLIFPTTKRKYKLLTVEGSLHKFWNNGEHNFNDFNKTALDNVIAELYSSFNIKPSNLILTQLETGVNINPDYKTELILACCLMHKKKMFKWVCLKEDGDYIQVAHSNYIVKIYNKRKQFEGKGYEFKKNIMRFELKMKRPFFSKIIGKSSKVSLDDILNFGLENFKDPLLQAWDHVLFYDFPTFGQSEYAEKYSNINYWNRLTDYEYRYHRENLYKLTYLNPHSLKLELRNKLSMKIDDLTTLIQPYNILLSSAV